MPGCRCLQDRPSATDPRSDRCGRQSRRRRPLHRQLPPCRQPSTRRIQLLRFDPQAPRASTERNLAHRRTARRAQRRQSAAIPGLVPCRTGLGRKRPRLAPSARSALNWRLRPPRSRPEPIRETTPCCGPGDPDRRSGHRCPPRPPPRARNAPQRFVQPKRPNRKLYGELQSSLLRTSPKDASPPVRH